MIIDLWDKNTMAKAKKKKKVVKDGSLSREKLRDTPFDKVEEMKKASHGIKMKVTLPGKSGECVKVAQPKMGGVYYVRQKRTEETGKSSVFSSI